MIKKYAFKRGQTVVFTPEEGVIVTGKIIAFHVFTNGFKKGGEPRPKRAAYTVEEPDGTLWSVEEQDIAAVEETAPEQEPVLKTTSIDVEKVKAYAETRSIMEKFRNDVPVRLYNIVNRNGYMTEWDLILLALDERRFGLRGYGKKVDEYLQGWLDLNYTGWRGFGNG